jgi:polysaccharide export outer membrane protein
MAPAIRGFFVEDGMRRLGFLFFALALPGALALSGCGLFGGQAEQAAAPAPPAARGDLLAAGDMVHITVAGEQELSGTFAIGQGGNVHLELVGDVRAAGLTSQMLANDLRLRLAAGYLKDPAVTVARAIPGAPSAVSGEPVAAGGWPAPPPLQGSVTEAGSDRKAVGKPARPRPAPALRRSQDIDQPY